MSPDGIAARLEALGGLYRVGVSLRSARRLGRVEDLQRRGAEPGSGAQDGDAGGQRIGYDGPGLVEPE